MPSQKSRQKQDPDAKPKRGRPTNNEKKKLPFSSLSSAAQR